ncbi:type 1 glutamine amidotransferase domain-containing protein [Paenibacillus yanchengensis]|uniref:Type 1 glutamine amidotransferase domain-containing protein n=1 Tax=Paenibacillus yanchengensis TaxID=2035833 RepID=A0ABW4YKK0_9BACL
MSLHNELVICLLDDECEDLELWYPVYRTREAGATVLFAGPEKGKTHIGKYGVPATADLSFAEVDSSKVSGLLIPGGWAPDKLRRYPEVLELVQQMDKANKPIGQICHAGWVLISAKILNNRKVTSTPGIRDDMENAGATWFDEPVVVDGNLISARRPPDLPPYAKAFVDALMERMN